MLHKRYLQLFCATFISLCVFDNITIHISSHTQPSINISNKAYARRGGGRSRGGSFRSSGTTSRRSSSSISSRSRRNYDHYPSGDTIIITDDDDTSIIQNESDAVPDFTTEGTYNADEEQNIPSEEIAPQEEAPATTSSTTIAPGGETSIADDISVSPFSNLFSLLILLLAFGGCVAMVSHILRSSKASIKNQELYNETVTVTQLQVALLAENSNIQSQLSELTLNVDTKNRQGRLQLLQESALTLLRKSENWTHVLASSKTVKSRESASTLFNKYSLQERSKFSAETLSNVEGIVKQQAYKLNSQDSAGYIVVTLLVGTADDQPLFGEIRTTQALQAGLEKIASMREDYLFVVELLWNPQAETEALTADELLSEYTDMIQIA